MGARSRCFTVPFAALLLAAAAVRAQDSGPVEQPPSEPLPSSEPCIPAPRDPSIYFQAEWLWTPHAGMWSNTRNFIDGPDAVSFDNLPAFSGDNGYRFQGGIRLGNWLFEAAYSHYGDWTSSLNRNINGVGFNAAAATGNWAVENALNGNTYFTPIVNAASLTAPVDTAGDQSGLGPSASFPHDSRPSLIAYSHSDFYMAEANVEGADYLIPLLGHGLHLGVGYVNANLNNEAWVSLAGTFRASNNSGTTVSLPNSVLTAPTGGYLTLYSGGGGGFTDGVSNGGTGTPSQLRFTHVAKTTNELNGAQVVLEGDVLEFRRLDLGLGLKAGIYDNYAQGTVIETYATTNNDLSVYARQFTGSCHHLAFMGGLGINAAYHVTDQIAICTGYDVVFLSNLALGPEQVNGIINNWYQVQTDGTAIIQAVHAGLQISY